jgi:protoporphyrinogen oxidase
MLSEKNILLGYFGLNSYDEIMTYIRDNPENEKVKEIKELFEIYSTDLDWEVFLSPYNLNPLLHLYLQVPYP